MLCACNGEREDVSQNAVHHVLWRGVVAARELCAGPVDRNGDWKNAVCLHCREEWWQQKYCMHKLWRDSTQNAVFMHCREEWWLPEWYMHTL